MIGVLATLTVRTWMAFLFPDVIVAVNFKAFPGVAEYFGIVKLMFRTPLSLLDKLSIWAPDTTSTTSMLMLY